MTMTMMMMMMVSVCVCVCVCVRMSPLHVAVLHDNVELTSLLLQHGALVDSADKKGLITRGPAAANVAVA